MTCASLAMYPFPELRSSYDLLWQGVRDRLSFTAPALDWDLDPDVACRRDDLLIGQTCGWPLITELADLVSVVGSFDHDVPDALDGTYRSVLIGAEPLADLLRRPGLRVAANSHDSLSGWISLRAVAAQAGAPLDDVVWTGSHAASIEAVSGGRADLASIDAVTWAHLGRSGPAVVGRGPRVPCLPLVTARSTTAADIAELRGSFAQTIADPALADACRLLRIRGFVERELADYQGLAALAPLG